MIKELSIDLETYSDVDISKCGAYKYAESDHFEILLFGVSVDNGPVVVYDLTAGDEIPTEILTALSDDTVTKWAFNASFERVCLSNWLRKHHPEYFKTYNSKGVYSDRVEHSARRFRADLSPFQSNLSALLSTPFRKSSAYLSGDECNDRFNIPPESLFRAL